jgi:quinol-cytochrome oxidoreductase complex cytochrome b subunit
MGKADRIVAALFGGVLLLIGLLAATGWTLHGSYEAGGSPTTLNVLAIRDNPSLGFLADLHYWASFTLLITSALLAATMLWTGAFDKPRRWAYLASIGTFLCAFGLQVTGNLLPMDAHDVQTVVIESSVASQIPLIGPTLKSWILAGDRLTEATVVQWYVWHRWVLSVAAIVFAVVGLLTSRRLASSPTPRLVIWSPVILAVVLTLCLPAPTGSPASAEDYARYDARPSWYVVPLHGLLRLAQDYTGSPVGAFLLPMLFLGLAIACAWVGPRTPTWIVRVVFLFGVALAIFASVPHFAVVAPIAGPQVPLGSRGEQTGATSQVRPINPALAATGRSLFNSLACAKCHGADGAKPVSGPDLTSVWRRHPDSEWYLKFIRSPSSVRPNALMPGFRSLTQAQLEQLAEFLRSPR